MDTIINVRIFEWFLDLQTFDGLSSDLVKFQHLVCEVLGF